MAERLLEQRRLHVSELHYSDFTWHLVNRRGLPLPAAPPPTNRRTSAGLFFKNSHRFLNLGCISTTVGMQWRLNTISGPRLNKSSVSATVVNVGCIPHPGVLSTLREPLQLGPASICTSGVGPSRQRWREGRV